MPAFLIPILGIFTKYWKPFLVFGVVLLLVFGVYYKGRKDERNRIQQLDQKETIRRVNRERTVIEKARKIRDNIEKLEPSQKDKTYSCILSNDPFKTDCSAVDANSATKPLFLAITANPAL